MCMAVREAPWTADLMSPLAAVPSAPTFQRTHLPIRKFIPSMTDFHSAIQAWLDRRDQSAARWIVETYRGKVRRTVERWLPHHQMVEDVVQDTFIRAFKSMHRLLPGSNLEAWLCSIARNSSANFLRGWQRNIVQTMTDCGIDDCTDMLATHDKVADEDAAIERGIEQLLSRLQQQDRRLLTLFHYEGRSARDVGQCLGLTEGNVRVRLMRSHRALRDQACAMRAEGIL